MMVVGKVLTLVVPRRLPTFRSLLSILHGTFCALDRIGDLEHRSSSFSQSWMVYDKTGRYLDTRTTLNSGLSLLVSGGSASGAALSAGDMASAMSKA